MLVLSRRIHEKILLPTIQTIIQVVGIKTTGVRLGVNAPTNVPVYREELLALADRESGLPVNTPQDDAEAALVHRLYNHLNCSTIGLALLRRQIELGKNKETLGTVERLEQELNALKATCNTLARPNSGSGPATLNRLPAPRALLVEDDVNECELLAGLLRLSGLRVDTAGDGADALDYIHNHGSPDLILLDMFLPRCDGVTTVRAVRDNPTCQGVKIFGVTGADISRIDLPEGRTGVDRWFRKPLNPEILLQELRRELHLGQAG